MVVNWQKTDSPSEQPKSPDLHRGAYIPLPATSREHKGAVQRLTVTESAPLKTS